MCDLTYILLMKPSCHENGHSDGSICEVDENKRITTRFYDIEVYAQDAAGNSGMKKCSVIVIPTGHYDLDTEVSTVGKKGKAEQKGSFNSRKSGGKKGKKGGKKGLIDGTQKAHKRNDLRNEYRLSTQRYLLSEENHVWDPALNNFLSIPSSLISLPPLSDLFDVTSSPEVGKKGDQSKSSYSGKGGKKGSISNKMLLCDQPFICQDKIPGMNLGKKLGKKSGKKLGSL